MGVGVCGGGALPTAETPATAEDIWLAPDFFRRGLACALTTRARPKTTGDMVVMMVVVVVVV